MNLTFIVRRASGVNGTADWGLRTTDYGLSVKRGLGWAPGLGSSNNLLNF